MNNRVNDRLNKRDIRLELMRIVALFFIIFNHTGKYGFYLFSKYDYCDFRFWLYLPWSVFCKFSVPLFFMISGALLLVKKESIKELYKKRVLRMFVVLVLVSIVYYVFDIAKGNVCFFGIGNVLDFIYYFITGNISFHLWFLYAYIVFLLISPLLKKLVDRITAFEFRYYYVLVLVMSVVIPVSQYVLFPGIEYNSSVLTAYNLLNSKTINIIVYPVVGYYLYHRFDYRKITCKKLFLLWITNIITIIITSLFLLFRIWKTGDCTESNSQQFHSMFALYNASVIFISIKHIETKKCNISIWIKRIILSIGECTFCIYLLHILIMRSFDNIHSMQMLSFFPLLGCFIYCFFVFFICFLISMIIKKIPVIKKYI